ncbi:DUF4261 domain-containing protein [Exiguobacterium sp. SH3S2]|nr:hypothetical protein A6395_04765 [Exiguobacterium sp. SH31]TCI27271.1 DUF4261 domain-containing protein [Exiguobacterium sp. SH5S4]TCI46101.1 DUF4261 domain-containing protein [Exiguobacterium sp. SH3S3]TCI51263.1 DUF4261 domain-containing protein [Exiguobacterium sp. SH5S13]TCI61189.1 DUF4261 domain-containing protein [Exiguobacterium sp. SH3S2]TCI64093.1 DUF4261 domain-containing protein [Exiguobacterium sp. SH3S1]TCI68176.1 DUF4261 domain-containing protein [Exiguobacterium sp. SH0S7]
MILMNRTQVLLAIPGNWPSAEAVSEKISLHSEGYTMAGLLLLEDETGKAFTVEVVERDPALAEAMIHASTSGFTPKIAKGLTRHTHIVYLIGDVNDVTDIAAARRGANALLNAGGLGVMVETAGVAYSKDEWQASKEEDLALDYSLLTAITEEETAYVSWGMKAFGHADVAVPETLEIEDAIHVIHSFNFHLIAGGSMFGDGDSFTFEDGKTFTVEMGEDERTSIDNLLHNPFGLIYLVPQIAE